MLSEPVTLLDLDLNQPDLISLAGSRLTRTVGVSRAGIANCVCWWSELDLPTDLDGATQTVDLGPPSLRRGGGQQRAPRACERRARKQVLEFFGYERRVEPGEACELHIHQHERHIAVSAPAPPSVGGAPSARLVRWPQVSWCW